jgi:hypothetical protein
MRKVLLATVLTLGMVSFASAQTVSTATSAAGGNTSANQAAISSVVGNGVNMSGGLTSSVSSGNDLSFAAGSPAGVVTGTTGSNESDVQNMTFSTGAGHDAGTAAGAGSANSFNFGAASAIAVKHH